MRLHATTISSLPNELLVAIAAAGQEDRVADLYSPDLQWQTPSRTFKSEWTLSHLSHRFRDVIAGAPALWTLIDVDLNDEKSSEILKLYLQRSRTYKISTTLHKSWDNDGSETEAKPEDVPEEMASLLTRVGQIVLHINRIRTLRVALKTDPEWGVEVLGPFRNVAAPHLERLELVYFCDEEPAVDMFMSGAPMLNFLRNDGLGLSLPGAPWAGVLTHLEIRKYPGSMDNGDLAAITAQFSALVHLRIDVTYVSAQTRKFRIPTLEFLYLYISEHAEFNVLEVIVDAFDTPALTDFTIDGTHGDQICILFTAANLLNSSFPALTSLSFISTGQCKCESQQLYFFPSLSASPPPTLFPALSEISLIGQCFTHKLIRLIFDPELCPRLEKVTLCPTERSLKDVHRALEEAANSTHQRSHPLPKTKIYTCASWDEANPGARSTYGNSEGLDEGREDGEENSDDEDENSQDEDENSRGGDENGENVDENSGDENGEGVDENSDDGNENSEDSEG
ncbi:hypothetical protein K438DRAFT_1804699 [Mycena galopus ATCC 62051]|nr:hypothetical protein K438DRAFT_1804699 [Mycena galopus ATCC 62051]